MIKSPTKPARAKTPAPLAPENLPQPGSRVGVPRLVGLGVSLLSLVLYILTLSPTVNFIDSGELITVGATAGIAHPPGYPLYTLLTIVGAALPPGDPAVGVNLVSALSAALAVGLFYALIYELVAHHFRQPYATLAVSHSATARGVRSGRTNGAKPQPALRSNEAAISGPEEWIAVGVAAGAALMLAASFTFWNWATMAKNYTLHYAFVAAIFLLALRARRSVHGVGNLGLLWPARQWPATARLLVILAATLGLAFTNHPMSTLLVPTLAVLVFWPQRVGSTTIGRTVVTDAPLWRWVLKYSPWLMVAGLLPFLLYLYLPLRSSQQPVLNWGSPDNLGDFWRHITLWQSSVLLGRPAGSILDYLGRAFDLYFNQLGTLLGLILLLLACVGIVRLARTATPFLVASVLLVLLTLYQTYGFQNAEVAAYSVPMYMMVIAWAGVGLYWLLNIFADRLFPYEEEYSQRAPWLAAIPGVLAALALIVNIGRAGHAGDYLADTYIRDHFKNFAPNAIVITNNWYLTSPSYYFQYVKHERSDVAIINRKLIQYPFYMNYANRQYPDIMGQVKDIADPFAQITRQWVNGEQVDAQRLSTLYFDMMRALIARNLAAGRPVYLAWDNPGPEEDFIAQGLSTHPEGFALRVDAQPYASAPPDPQFDLRGILTDMVHKDDIAPLVLDEYPAAFDRLAAFARQNNHSEEADRYTALANQVRQALETR